MTFIMVEKNQNKHWMMLQHNLQRFWDGRSPTEFGKNGTEPFEL
jgi:hypothetical protein